MTTINTPIVPSTTYIQVVVQNPSGTTLGKVGIEVYRNGTKYYEKYKLVNITYKIDNVTMVNDSTRGWAIKIISTSDVLISEITPTTTSTTAVNSIVEIISNAI